MEKSYIWASCNVVVNGKIMRNMETVHLHMLGVMYMMVNGKMVTDMEKVHIHGLVVMYMLMLVNGKMISDMEKAKETLANGSIIHKGMWKHDKPVR